MDKDLVAASTRPMVQFGTEVPDRTPGRLVVAHRPRPAVKTRVCTAEVESYLFPLALAAHHVYPSKRQLNPWSATVNVR